MNIAVDELANKIEAIYPELDGLSDLYLQVVSDLHSKALIANILPERHLPARLTDTPEHTIIAKEFLKTIKITYQKYVDFCLCVKSFLTACPYAAPRESYGRAACVSTTNNGQSPTPAAVPRPVCAGFIE